MSNHGVVAYGADLHHAYMKMETVEHFAQMFQMHRRFIRYAARSLELNPIAWPRISRSSG